MTTMSEALDAFDEADKILMDWYKQKINGIPSMRERLDLTITLARFLLSLE